MDKRQILLDFLDWMDKIMKNEPFKLETDNDDMVDMYLEDKEE